MQHTCISALIAMSILTSPTVAATTQFPDNTLREERLFFHGPNSNAIVTCLVRYSPQNTSHLSVSRTLITESGAKHSTAVFSFNGMRALPQNTANWQRLTAQLTQDCPGIQDILVGTAWAPLFP